MSLFTFNERLDGRDIKVLRIQPSFEKAEDCVELSKTNLENCASYLALSYAWGDFEEDVAVQCNGQQFFISKSLHAALRHLRACEAPEWFWADQICINDADGTEKATQLKTMQETYGRVQDLSGVSQQRTTDMRLLFCYQSAINAGLQPYPDQEVSRVRLQLSQPRHIANRYYGLELTSNQHSGQGKERERLLNCNTVPVLRACLADKPGVLVQCDQSVATDTMQRCDPNSAFKSGTMDTPPLLEPRNRVEGFKQRYKRADAASFFTKGQVFAIIWHQNQDATHGSKHTTDLTRSQKRDRQAIGPVQRILVVQETHGRTFCVPLNTCNCVIVQYAARTPSEETRKLSTAEAFLDSHSKIPLQYSARMAENRSNTTHKPQEPPPRMSPDDDDDDESYGFRRASCRATDQYNETKKSSPRSRERDSKKHRGRQEHWIHHRSRIDHHVLSEWRSVIDSICGPRLEAREQDLWGSWKEVSTGVAASKRLNIAAAEC